MTNEVSGEKTVERIHVWVEVLSNQRFEEIEDDVPAEWGGMSESARDEYMTALFNDMRDGIANGGYEVVRRVVE